MRRQSPAGVVAKGIPVANMVLESTALSLVSSSAPVLSAEMDPNTGRPAVAVSLHLKVRMDIAVLLEVLEILQPCKVKHGTKPFPKKRFC